MANRQVSLNGRMVDVEISPSAMQVLVLRATPLYVELELYFSSLVKKFAHFREDSRGSKGMPSKPAFWLDKTTCLQ
jgi:hypothetical protein